MSGFHRPRPTDDILTPATSAHVSSRPFVQEDKPDDDDEWNQLQKFVSSPSAPTTPRTKRKIHFIEPSPEDIAPRRSNTVPPGFRSSSSAGFERDTIHSEGPYTDEPPQNDLISFEEPEETSAKTVEQADQASSKSPEDQDPYDMEVEMMVFPDDSDPTEELPQVSPGEADDSEDAKEPILSLRHAKSRSMSGPSTYSPDQTASSRFYRTSSASGLYSKPAYSPIIKAHVAASPIRFDIYAVPFGGNDSEEQNIAALEDVPPLDRSRTASSKSSISALSMTRNDKTPDSDDGSPSPPHPLCSPGGRPGHSPRVRGELPLEAVRRKLSDMSRMRRTKSKSAEKASSESLSSPEEIPAAPPTTRATSGTRGKSNESYRTRHSRSSGSSPLPTPSTSSHVWSEAQSPASETPESTQLKPAIKQGSFSKAFGGLRGHDRSPGHRDSLELVRDRLSEGWPTVDPNLACSRDSIILAKQRLDKYPKSHLVVDKQTGQVQLGGLSPIMDASPPDAKAYLAARREQLAKQKEMNWHREIGGHAANDDDCPICQIERPRSKRLASLRTG